MQLWKRDQDSLDYLRGHSLGSLLALPSLLHWAAKDRRLCRESRTIQESIWQNYHNGTFGIEDFVLRRTIGAVYSPKLQGLNS